ncbi:acid phosphatase-domain-containing protein [Lasiosphaeria miniovina]|uniref:Acid phosphatase-domain-containing protein n=1 Tax=Lasiosphaeria miniovina TaxID=1954250 RepID=A0AA40B4K6_9PEZI|nr:acid phosphatase-domain-containing protein [Lasiosphaeria miniovina]KAK0727576.1 acid phosphatase-domain-containing protein [Lasiosphaeria miniovina]
MASRWQPAPVIPNITSSSRSRDPPPFIPPELFPKVVGIDLDGTFWTNWLNKDEVGIRGQVTQEQRDNLEHYITPDGATQQVRDKTNPKRMFVNMSYHMPQIIRDLKNNGVKIAIVSKNTSKDLTDRALYYFNMADPSHIQPLREQEARNIKMISQVDYNEVYDESKQVHFAKIKGWSGASYDQMLFFDDQPVNMDVELWQGVTFFKVSDPTHGLSYIDYLQGLELWRRNRDIRHKIPMMLGQDSNVGHVGYVGSDAATKDRYAAGKRRLKSGRPSRWGHALYVADDPDTACVFSMWGRESDPKTNHWISAVFVRDRKAWLDLPKVWVPEFKSVKQTPTNTLPTEEEAANIQQARDEFITKTYGVKKPYVLFSRHHYMDVFKDTRIPQGSRFNELVVYPQIQDALFFCVPIQNHAGDLLHGPTRTLGHLNYNSRFHDWGIKKNSETERDFWEKGEAWA